MTELDVNRRLYAYKLLNSVKPVYFQTKFPYNLVTKDKILVTDKKIKIMVKSTHNTNKSGTKSGGGDNRHSAHYAQPIIFYG